VHPLERHHFPPTQQENLNDCIDWKIAGCNRFICNLSRQRLLCSDRPIEEGYVALPPGTILLPTTGLMNNKTNYDFQLFKKEMELSCRESPLCKILTGLVKPGGKTNDLHVVNCLYN